MKKQAIMAVLAISTLGLGAGIHSQAAEVKGKTDTDVQFDVGERPKPVVPEEGPKDPEESLDEDPVTPPELNGVYITHLPTISFGSDNQLSAQNTEYHALMEKRTANGGTETIYLPHSVQVADVSGSDQTKWEVTVQQEDVYKSS